MHRNSSLTLGMFILGARPILRHRVIHNTRNHYDREVVGIVVFLYWCVSFPLFYASARM